MLSLLVLVTVLAGLGVLLFLGGMCSALLEARREVRAGLPVSRPAWERRDARRASGGAPAYLRGMVRGLRS